MTDNQNVNKTTMKDVQLQHFLFKRASSENVWNVSENLVFLFFLNRWTSLEAATTTGSYYNWVSYKTFLFPFATRKFNLSLCIFLKALREAIEIAFLSQIFSTCHDMK